MDGTPMLTDQQCRRLLMAALRGTAEPDTAVRQKAERTVEIKAADPELQCVYGEVYAPGVVPDTQQDVMTADEVRKAAWGFLANGRVEQIDIQHDNQKCGALVVESFVARDDDAVFAPGSWVLGVHVPDRAVWQAIKDGEINGFSFQALVGRTQAEVELWVPDELQGMTEKAEADEHEHTYTVRFDEDGNFLGGETDTVAGHWHPITKSSITDAPKAPGNGKVKKHSHRYHWVDAVEELNARMEAPA